MDDDTRQLDLLAIFHYVVAGIECIFMPFGTVLGVLTLLVLMRPSVKALFDEPPSSGR